MKEYIFIGSLMPLLFLCACSNDVVIQKATDDSAHLSSSYSSTKTAQWKEFTNKKYGYSLRYPSDSKIGSNQYGVGNASESATVAINRPATNKISDSIFEIRVLDDFHGQSVLQFVEARKTKIAELVGYNKDRFQITVGPLEQRIIDGQQAYSFLFERKYIPRQDEGAYANTFEESVAMEKIFIQENGQLFEISRRSDKQYSSDILDSLKFVK